jgi:membrane protein
VVSAMARINAVRESALRRVEQAPRPLLRLAMTFVREITNMEVFDRAMTLAAQAFTSIFPLLISLETFFGDGSGSVGRDLASSLSLPDSVQDALGDTLPSDSDQLAALGIVSVLVVLISATSFSRALGRMYAKAWHEPPSGWLGGWRWVVVIVAVCSAAVAVQVANHAADILAEDVAALALTFLLNTLLWLVVPWLLLVGRVSVVRLLPGAILMGVASIVLTLAGRIYLPYALDVASEHFGAFGIAFSLIGWLFVVGFVLIVATVLGAVVVQDEWIHGHVTQLRTWARRHLRRGHQSETLT